MTPPLGVSRRSIIRKLPSAAGIAAEDAALHHWRMGEGSGTSTADAVGSADGAITGATWVDDTTYIDGHALSGDGTDDYVETSTWGSFGSNLDTGFTIVHSISTTDSDGRYIGIANNGDSTRLYCAIGSYVGAGKLSLFISDDAGNAVARKTDATYDDGGTYRVAMVSRDGTAANMEIWIDGAEAATTADRDQGFGTSTNFDVPVYLLAMNSAGSADTFLNGVLDDVVVYDKALSQSEIEEDYNRQSWS